MLHLEDVRKTYRTGNFTQSALDGVTITFRDNEFVAVLGPSGSGKTTLLNIVGGLDHADDGDLVIDDISTEQYSDRQWDTYRNNRIGFVFQNYHLIPHQTVLANVELALTLSGVGPTERRERAIAALEQVELGDHIHKSPNQLSGGQMQRVAIARALINDPEIVLADEPTGALDTKTGDQVMGLLKQIAEKRLVVMVTHNPDLASQYATRIVSLRDGKVVSDTDPYIPTANAREAKTARRTSMSFFTAISLSFTNLLTKKGRTLMTSFAGSIGIVGIATILAVATGFNAYIRGIEESTLSLYPLQISSQAFDISSMMGGGTGSGLGGSRRDVGPDEVYEISMLSRMFSRVTTNDLRSLKAFLDSDSTNIGQWANSIDYHYSLTPQIFAVDSPDKVRQINPNNVFSSLGMGSDMNSLLMGGFSMNVFSALPDDVDFMIGQHEVVAGRWPQTPNECLVVLTESGGVSDMMLYAMGLRDPAVLDKMVEEMANGNPIEAPAPGGPVSFKDLMSVDFRVVPAASFYEYDETYKVWTDRRSDQTWLKNTVAAGQTMKVVGIVKPLPGEVGLSTGLWYPGSLIFHLMDQATKADIVIQQRTNPEVNVLSGKTFEEEAKRPSLSDFDFATMLNVDPEILGALFGGGLTGVDFSGMDFSGIDLSGMDLSGLDLSGIDLSQIGGGQMSLPAFDLLQFLAGINIEVSWSELLPLLSDTLAEYLTYALGNLPDPDPDNPDDPGTSLPTIDELLNGFIGWFSTSGAQDVFMERLGEVVNLEDLTDQVAKAFGAYMAQVMQSMLESMMSTLQTQLTVVMRGMTAAMQSMMTQAVGQIASLFSSLSFDPAALSDLFSFSMQPEQLTSLLMSMMSNQSNSLDSNLRQLGYADPANPSSIDIYPKDFASKQSILATLDSYNDRMRDSDQEDKVVTYTDYVGMMMNSVTSIVDTVSVVLTVFVSISLVVSSIMIGVITYISVLERRKEIGILRALGASKRDIGNVFNAETLIVGFIAGALGMLISLGLVTLANPIIYSLTDVPNLAQLPAGALVLIAVSMLLTFVSGLIPSSAASRKDPVEALRSE